MVITLGEKVQNIMELTVTGSHAEYKLASRHLDSRVRIVKLFLEDYTP